MTITRKNYFEETKDLVSEFPLPLKTGHEVMLELRTNNIDIAEILIDNDLEEFVNLQILKSNEFIKKTDSKPSDLKPIKATKTRAVRRNKVIRKTVVKTKLIKPEKAPVEKKILSFELQIIKKLLSMHKRPKKLNYLENFLSQIKQAINYGALHNLTALNDTQGIVEELIYNLKNSDAEEMELLLKEETRARLKSYIDKAKVRARIEFLGGINNVNNELYINNINDNQDNQESNNLNENLTDFEDFNDKKKTLNNSPNQPAKIQVKKTNTLKNSELDGILIDMSEIDFNNESNSFELNNKEISMFLGDIEIKSKGSIVNTLDAPAGTGKTRAAFQILNSFAESGYKCCFVSLEEHPQSQLFIQKRDEYISDIAMDNIQTVGELPDGFNSLNKIAELFDVVIVDSWGKVNGGKNKLDEFRNNHNGKYFLVIFQRVSNGSMRGGSDSEFDADIITRAEKSSNYKENYLYHYKNRYSKENYIYNVFEQATLPFPEDV